MKTTLASFCVCACAREMGIGACFPCMITDVVIQFNSIITKRCIALLTLLNLT